MTPTSKLEAARLDGSTQVDYQRRNILDSAERLFLAKGLESTTMGDIAAEAGISRVSLYRYFPDRHPIAFEIAVRMLHQIYAAADPGEHPVTIETQRKIIMRMIDQFDTYRDAHRYLGMFDHFYSDRYPNETIAAWYRDQLTSLAGGDDLSPGSLLAGSRARLIMTYNTANSFLQKMAARGELMAAEQHAPLAEQLSHFKHMMNVYFDDWAAHESNGPV